MNEMPSTAAMQPVADRSDGAAETAPAAEAERLDLPKPGPGESQIVPVDGVRMVGFTGIALADVVLRLNGDSLEFLFDNSGRIVLEEVRHGAGGPSATLLQFGATEIGADELVEVLVALTPPGGETSPEVPIETALGLVHGGGADFTNVEFGNLASGAESTGALGETDDSSEGRADQEARSFADHHNGQSEDEGTVRAGPVNQAPVGEAELVLTNIVDGSPIAIPVDWLLENDSDPDGDALALIDPLGNGGATAVLDGAGNVVFTPGQGPFANGSFTYKLVDDGAPAATSDPVDVQINATAGKHITGSGDAEILIGGAGNDFLRGKGGRDFLHGGDGDDRVNGGGGRDVLVGGAGNDKLDGGNGDDYLLGESGDDKLVGGAGNNVLDGGVGNDILISGSGVDRFIVSNLGDTDTIFDIQTGTGGDIIDIGSVLTGVSSHAGVDLVGHLQFTRDGADTVLTIDADGGGDFGSPDATIVLANVDLIGGGISQKSLIDQLIDDGNLDVG